MQSYKALFPLSMSGAFAGALLLNLVSIDFSRDTPAPAKMGTELIHIFCTSTVANALANAEWKH